MSFMLSAMLWVVALMVVMISKWMYRWSNPKCNGKLPPGTMGFPIIGETFDFFEVHGLYDILPFVKKRMSRYGPMFRTNFCGSNTVVLTEPDVIFEVFRQENKSFILSYPELLVKHLAKDNLLAMHGKIHKYAKQITLQFIGSEGLKTKMIRDMDRVTREHLRSKATKGSLDVKDTVESVIMAHLIPNIVSNLKPETQRSLMENLKAIKFDWFGSLFTIRTWLSIYKVTKASRAAVRLIEEILTRRKASAEKYGDFLNTMVEELEKEDPIFNEVTASKLIFFLQIVANHSTSLTSSLAVKLIAQNPKVLAELKREHEAILRNRHDKDAGITWEEYRHSMTFTNMVINETLRIGSLNPVLFRKAVNDVEIKGYTVPAGWIVAVVPSSVHHDPAVYENPLEFNPWRWEGKELRTGSKTFMAFGGGIRQCVGAELARLQISIFVHHLVTNYDFSLAQEFEFVRTPHPSVPNGLLINISQTPKTYLV